MTEILLGALAFVGLLIALALYRVGGAIWSLMCSVNSGQEEIAEALWAQAGCTREQWREHQKRIRDREIDDKNFAALSRMQK